MAALGQAARHPAQLEKEPFVVRAARRLPPPQRPRALRRHSVAASASAATLPHAVDVLPLGPGLAPFAELLPVHCPPRLDGGGARPWRHAIPFLCATRPVEDVSRDLEYCRALGEPGDAKSRPDDLEGEDSDDSDGGDGVPTWSWMAALTLSAPHNSRDPCERRRVLAAGGPDLRLTSEPSSAGYLVREHLGLAVGGVNMTRAIGDSELVLLPHGPLPPRHAALSCVPTVLSCSLGPGDLVVLASDSLTMPPGAYADGYGHDLESYLAQSVARNCSMAQSVMSWQGACTLSDRLVARRRSRRLRAAARRDRAAAAARGGRRSSYFFSRAVERLDVRLHAARAHCLISWKKAALELFRPRDAEGGKGGGAAMPTDTAAPLASPLPPCVPLRSIVDGPVVAPPTDAELLEAEELLALVLPAVKTTRDFFSVTQEFDDAVQALVAWCGEYHAANPEGGPAGLLRLYDERRRPSPAEAAPFVEAFACKLVSRVRQDNLAVSVLQVEGDAFRRTPVTDWGKAAAGPSSPGVVPRGAASFRLSPLSAANPFLLPAWSPAAAAEDGGSSGADFRWVPTDGGSGRETAVLVAKLVWAEVLRLGFAQGADFGLARHLLVDRVGAGLVDAALLARELSDLACCVDLAAASPGRRFLLGGYVALLQALCRVAPAPRVDAWISLGPQLAAPGGAEESESPSLDVEDLLRKLVLREDFLKMTRLDRLPELVAVLSRRRTPTGVALLLGIADGTPDLLLSDNRRSVEDDTTQDVDLLSPREAADGGARLAPGGVPPEAKAPVLARRRREEVCVELFCRMHDAREATCGRTAWWHRCSQPGARAAFYRWVRSVLAGTAGADAASPSVVGDWLLRASDADGWTCLWEAVYRGDEITVSALARSSVLFHHAVRLESRPCCGCCRDGGSAAGPPRQSLFGFAIAMLSMAALDFLSVHQSDWDQSSAGVLRVLMDSLRPLGSRRDGGGLRDLLRRGDQSIVAEHVGWIRTLLDAFPAESACSVGPLVARLEAAWPATARQWSSFAVSYPLPGTTRAYAHSWIRSSGRPPAHAVVSRRRKVYRFGCMCINPDG